jgi:predicted proteasome-type protease
MIDENQQVDVKTNEILDEDISDDELLAIIAEVNLDSKDVLEKIKDVNESTGVALHAADKDHEIGILVGREIKTCVAKEDIDKYQLVKFINEGTDTELLVVPLKTYVKDILTKLEEIDFATSAKQLPDNHQVTANAGTDLNTSLLALESGGNLEKIADDFATESTLSELNDKVN